MSLELLDYTSEGILQLFRDEFYKQYGKPLIIGQDEFTNSAVFTYVLTVLVNAINHASDMRFIDTATGLYLDAIAAVNGLSRPNAQAASAVFDWSPKTDNAVYQPGFIQVSDGNGHLFKNTQILSSNQSLCILYAENTGSAYNGIPVDSINIMQGQTALVLNSIRNLTVTEGADDGYPYTPEGDSRFREYIKTQRSAYIVGGTAPAYRAKAMGVDNRILDAYIFKDGDLDFERGKIKVALLFDRDQVGSYVRNAIVGQVQVILRADDFRPVGDYVEVSEASHLQLDIDDDWHIVYPMKFKDLCLAHIFKVLSEYRSYLATGFNRPFSESELAKRFITPDADGVYALAFDVYGDAVYSEPDTGKVWALDWFNSDPEDWALMTVEDLEDAGILTLI
jgi:phage-related baseplate assembly protein